MAWAWVSASFGWVSKRTVQALDYVGLSPFKPLTWRSATALLGAFITFFISYYNSFQVSTQSEEHGAYITQSFLSFFKAPETDIRDRITVLTYHRETRVYFSETADAPIVFDGVHPPYAVQARVIDKLTDMGAAAIFLDYDFNRYKSDPEGVAVLLEAVRRAQHKQVSVYVGAVGKPPEVTKAADIDHWLGTAQKTPFERFGAHMQTGGAQKTRLGKAREVSVRWEADHDMDYPASDTDLRPTAAFALYRDLCRNGHFDDLACLTLTKRIEKHIEGTEALPPLAVQWRNFSPSPDMRIGSHNPTCRTLRQGLFLTSLYGLYKNLFYRAARDAGYKSNPCLYIRSRPIQALFPDGFDQSLLETGPEGEDDEAFVNTQYAAFAENDIRGRVVMIGSALDDDNFPAPGQGVVPAVHFHAMALENLMSYGEKYYRWPTDTPTFLGGKIGADYFLTVVLAFAAGMLTVRFARVLSDGPSAKRTDRPSRAQARLEPQNAMIRREPPDRQPLWLLLTVGFAVVTALILSLFTAALTAFWFHWTPFNCLNVMLATLGIFTLMEHESIAKHFMHITRLDFFLSLLGGVLLVFAIAGPLVFGDLVLLQVASATPADSVDSGPVLRKAFAPLIVFILYLLVLALFHRARSSKLKKN